MSDSQRLRALFISETMPYPLNTGGRQRIYHLLRGVAAVSDVVLVCLLQDEADRDYVGAVQELCQEVHCVPRRDWGTGGAPRSRLSAWGQSFLECCDPTRPAFLRWYDSATARALVATLCTSPPDLVWARRLPSMALLPRSLTTRVIVDLEDLEHRRLASRLRNTPLDRMTVFHWLEAAKLRRLERGLLALPHEFVVCSELDRRVIGGGPRVTVIPNGVTLSGTPPTPRRRETAPSFVFVGTLSYVANVDAVTFFAHSILPLIRRERPDARFVVVGRDPAPEVRQLNNGAAIQVVGPVDAVEPYLREASAAVVPIRFGGGTRIKILEAMAHGVPVVSTSIGAEGLDVETSRDLLLADSPSAFAQACLRIAADPSLASRLASQAFDLVRRSYQWSNIEERVKALVLRTRRPFDTDAHLVRTGRTQT